MKTIGLLLLAVVPFSLAQDDLLTFNSPDRSFRFRYSGELVDCLHESQETESNPTGVPRIFLGEPAKNSIPAGCMSQGVMCGDGGSETNTIACYAFPKSRFRQKPGFGAATFFVGTTTDKTEQRCMQASPYWNVDAVSTTKIKGVEFKIFSISDNWTSGGQSGNIYRTFHSKQCYELGVQQAATSEGAFDPGTFKHFTSKDERQVQRLLRQPLHSFEFLK